MLNKTFIRRKIKLIQEDLAKLEALSKYSTEELDSESVAYAALERYLERIVTRAIDLNRHIIAETGKGNESVRTYEDTFHVVSSLGIYPAKFAEEIAPSAGLRNILVHEYDDVDEEIIHQSLGKALSQYAKYCKYIIKALLQ